MCRKNWIEQYAKVGSDVSERSVYAELSPGMDFDPKQLESLKKKKKKGGAIEGFNTQTYIRMATWIHAVPQQKERQRSSLSKASQPLCSKTNQQTDFLLAVVPVSVQEVGYFFRVAPHLLLLIYFHFTAFLFQVFILQHIINSKAWQNPSCCLFHFYTGTETHNRIQTEDSEASKCMWSVSEELFCCFRLEELNFVLLLC